MAFDGDGDNLPKLMAARGENYPDRQMMLFAADIWRRSGSGLSHDVRLRKL